MRNRSPDRTILGHTRVAAPGQAMEIDAQLIGPGLGLEPAQAHALMEAGKISLVCERGTGQDEGWHRVRFYHAGRRLLLLIDPDGRIFAG